MQTVLLSMIVPVIFFAIVVMVWLAVQLLAINRLGERKQGCKGPVPGGKWGNVMLQRRWNPV